jgi:hypothetical protein
MIKAQRRDLEEFRCLSLDGCYRVLRRLLRTGVLTEVLPPVRKREGRSWTSTSRVYEVPPPAGAVPEPAPVPPEPPPGDDGYDGL